MAVETVMLSVIDMIKAGGSIVSIILNVIVLWRLRDMQSTITSLSSGKRWTETCDEKHKAINERMKAIEEDVTTLWEKVYAQPRKRRIHAELEA